MKLLYSKSVRTHVAALLMTTLAFPTETFAQFQDDTHRVDLGAQHWYTRFTTNYEPRIVRPISVGNSSRIDSLLRAGNLYLSLQDVIALALENNLDIELQRYSPKIAETDVLRAAVHEVPIPHALDMATNHIRFGDGFQLQLLLFNGVSGLEAAALDLR